MMLCSRSHPEFTATHDPKDTAPSKQRSSWTLWTIPAPQAALFRPDKEVHPCHRNIPDRSAADLRLLLASQTDQEQWSTEGHPTVTIQAEHCLGSLSDGTVSSGTSAPDRLGI